MRDKNIVWFSEVGKEDITIVGGKGANLGELCKLKVSVPNGFIVTSQAYFDNLSKSGALDRIRGILYDLDVENPTLLESKARQCQEEVRKIEMDKNLEKELFAHYKQLSGSKDVYVAVRSSATAEDLPDASFAGQQATFLNVKGEQELKKALLDSWASLFEARAIYYRVTKKFDHFKVGLATPVQKMVQSETSGIMFTIDPVANNKNVIVIEAIFGLGELIVGGRLTPDHYEISKQDFKITAKSIVLQPHQLIRGKKGNRLVEISKAYRQVQKLPDEKIIELAKIGKAIEKHYYFPQDTEWAYEKQKLYIVQTRPVTTVNKVQGEKINPGKSFAQGLETLLQGAPASPLIGTGKVVIVKNIKELGKIQNGDVLVTEMTNPDFVPAMKRAVAIVTDRGGRTSHAAIVSRELGIACVVGTQEATKKLKEGMIVTVDGSSGTIYKGQVLKSTKTFQRANTKNASAKHFKTATNLYVNLAEPELATQIAAKNVDGIGLLRAEFILAQIGVHPKKFIEEKRDNVFVEKMADKLSIFARAFGDRPVIYRASDLKSNEYGDLQGGDKFEPKEPNPMLGYRGAYRYIKDPDPFKLELKAVLKVREKHKNLHLMIPFVRTPKELITVKNIIGDVGLFNDSKFKLYMMVEIPSNVILLEEFIKIGINGVSIGSNDLTMLILGTDRDNEEVAQEFDEMNPAVLWAFEKIIKTSAKYKISSSICGQAPSIYPELTQKLVAWGITSISVNPDVIESTREHIYNAESKLLNRN